MKRSIENLHHFQCDKCNKWWSIGDAPKLKTTWWCPWCGEKHEPPPPDPEEGTIAGILIWKEKVTNVYHIEDSRRPCNNIVYIGEDFEQVCKVMDQLVEVERITNEEKLRILNNVRI